MKGKTGGRAARRRAAAGMLAGLLLLAATGAVAQGADNRDWNRVGDTLAGAVGLHYGKLGGHGLSFRVPTEWWLYFQAAGGIWHTEDKQRHNLGLEAHYLLRQDRTLRIYMAAGAGYFYERDKVDTVAGVDRFDTDRHWNYGAGLGLEVLQGERWSWQLEADFVHDGGNDDIKVAPQLGVYYYW